MLLCKYFHSTAVKTRPHSSIPDCVGSLYRAVALGAYLCRVPMQHVLVSEVNGDADSLLYPPTLTLTLTLSKAVAATVT